MPEVQKGIYVSDRLLEERKNAHLGGRMFSEWWQNKNGTVAGLNGIDSKHVNSKIGG